jgi:SGNH hydrolase-like domain, acetyltransferase AlgX
MLSRVRHPDTLPVEQAAPDTLEIIWTPDPPATVPGNLTPDGTPGSGVPGSGTPGSGVPGDGGSTEASIARSAPEELRELLVQLKTEHRRRRSVRAARLLTGTVAAGLLGVWLLGPPLPGGTENRAEAAFPRVGAASLADGSAFRQTDAALRDRLALRGYVVSAIGDAAKNKLGVSLSPQVVLGDGGTPFTAEDFTLPCERSFDPAAVDASLQGLRDLGAANGKTITVAVAPDKSSILTGQLGRFGSALMSCSDRVREATQAQWGGNNRAPVITMWDPMRAVEDTEPGQVYQHGDTHWTSRGALVFSRALMRQLVAQGEAPKTLAGQPRATRGADSLDDADLYRMMGTPRQEQVPVWLVSRPEVTVTAKRLSTASGQGMPIYHTEAPAGVPLVTGRTLVVRDSFFTRAEPQLAPFFSDLTVMHWADFITAADRNALPDFDRIVIETVERGWPQRASWLQPGSTIHDAIAAALSRPAAR